MRYINVKLAGMKTIRAYENTEKNSDNEPDFKSDGITVWLHDERDARNGNRRYGCPRQRQRFADEYEESSLREPAFAAQASGLRAPASSGAWCAPTSAPHPSIATAHRNFTPFPFPDSSHASGLVLAGCHAQPGGTFEMGNLDRPRWVHSNGGTLPGRALPGALQISSNTCRPDRWGLPCDPGHEGDCRICHPSA